MSKFWNKFESLMDNLPDYIDEQIEKADLNGFSSSKSVQIHNGTTVVTTKKNGKSKTTVNGKEVVPKDLADELYETLESVIKKLEVNTLTKATSERVSKAMKAYNKHKGK